MKIYVVGLGPGKRKDMTFAAAAALAESDVLCGYHVYTDLVKEDYPDKPILTTPMKQEVDRCRMAVEEALKGKTVAMVCSGDAGVYGMAGLIYEVAQQYPPIEIEILPGITAALSGAAVLGAPLMHDFATISLSDLLTPWELIERRLAGAAASDMVICLYNPSSKKRGDYLRRACEIIEANRPQDVWCGYVVNIGRDGEQAVKLPLSQLKEQQVDMFTTVFIGNSQTKLLGDKLVTPRGYSLEGR